MSSKLTDQQAREMAIDPSQSFIVQAPAGSGKTELLTQRYLKLLSHVEKNPEEIIAVTFTRKAAAEMRQRVIDALKLAEHKDEPTESHKKTTWRLAKNALANDKKFQWHLLSNPNRIRILTIDALAAYITQQMPLNAKLSLQLNVTDQPTRYYREAVETILYQLNDNPSWQPSIERLLLHLDNRAYLLIDLLIEILSKREQWLPHLAGSLKHAEQLREHMEAALKTIAIETLETAALHLTGLLLSELIPLAEFAGSQCYELDPENPISHLRALDDVNTNVEDLAYWQGIAHLLLTQKGEWRKSITKRQGFPAKSEAKPKMLAFLELVSENDFLKESLYKVMQIPPLHYNAEQWSIIEALLELLPILAAQLNLIFCKENVTDFVEINLAALRALGNSEQPTNLALHLDYRINHLLIDEFQDTSVIQYQLVEKLIEGWQPNDGRSIFLVGDPMQSIYRFRNAEVGLFLQAQQRGIAHIPLQALTLKKNFRSHQNIVEWNNTHFKTIFPNTTDIATGATPYSNAEAVNSDQGETQWHATLNDDGQNEASTVASLIQEIQSNSPEDSIAILVRSRSHLTSIIEQLHQAQLSFQAIELEPLAQRPEVSDIHSLTRALLHHADRVAWLAVLRAPFCGLTLNDLYVIANAANSKTIWAVLKDYESLEDLSNDGMNRLQHLLPALKNAIENYGRSPLGLTLRNLWTELNAVEMLHYNNQQDNVESYFDLIESLEIKSSPISTSTINERLNSLFAKSKHQDSTQLHVMTIHKAKGLEFDHILLPGLHRKSPSDRHQILKWLERPNHQNQTDLILAPIKAIDQNDDAIYSYLKRIEKEKADLECARLLYVATTRAKKSLHLFANALMTDGIMKEPAKGSFLQILWQHAASFFEDAAENQAEFSDEELMTPMLRRFKLNYLNTLPIPELKPAHYSQAISFSTNEPDSRLLGTLIHEALEHLAQSGNPEPERWLARMRQLNLTEMQTKTFKERIEHALLQTQNDPRGQWILSNKHLDAQCEYALSFFENNEVKNIIIDRTFVDAEGVRWIIDYKTSKPSPEQLSGYRNQLETYARAMQLYDQAPIRLALYFPLTSEWLEWEFASATVIA